MCGSVVSRQDPMNLIVRMVEHQKVHDVAVPAKDTVIVAVLFGWRGEQVDVALAEQRMRRATAAGD